MLHPSLPIGYLNLRTPPPRAAKQPRNPLSQKNSNSPGSSGTASTIGGALEGRPRQSRHLADRFGWVNGRNDSHPAAATITSENVRGKYAFQEFSPGVIAGPHARVAFWMVPILGLKRIDSLRRGQARAGMSGGSGALPVRSRRRLPRGGREEGAMVRVRDDLGRRHERMSNR